MKSESSTVIKREHSSSSNVKPKYAQKFCEKWMNIFTPWLTRCEDDPNKPFCRACQCRLDCNRCHLHRHERTSKHIRNLEILVNKGEGAARQNLSIRQERSKYYHQRTNVDSIERMYDDSDMDLNAENENIEYFDNNDQTIQASKLIYEDESDDNFIEKDNIELADSVEAMETNRTKCISEIEKTNSTRNDEEIQEELGHHNGATNFLRQIHKDKNDLLDSFKDLVNGTLAPQPSPKNHIDLFFESVSSSVKALSPKLIAEAKMRVSQVICELELRALNECNDSKNSDTIEAKTFNVHQSQQASKVESQTVESNDYFTFS